MCSRTSNDTPKFSILRARASLHISVNWRKHNHTGFSKSSGVTANVLKTKKKEKGRTPPPLCVEKSETQRGWSPSKRRSQRFNNLNEVWRVTCGSKHKNGLTCIANVSQKLSLRKKKREECLVNDDKQKKTNRLRECLNNEWEDPQVYTHIHKRGVASNGSAKQWRFRSSGHVRPPGGAAGEKKCATHSCQCPWCVSLPHPLKSPKQKFKRTKRKKEMRGVNAKQSAIMSRDHNCTAR